MKHLLLFLLLPFTLAQAQVPDPVKQLHYFVGKWKAETGKDTLLTAVDKPFGNGLIGSITLKINGKVVKKTQQLFGFDAATNTFIESEVSTDAPPELWSCWWTSETVMVGVPLDFRSRPGESPIRIEIHILTPNRYQQRIFVNNQQVFTKTMNRRGLGRG